MKPSHETIEKFKRLYTQEFGENLSDAEAYERFSRLVNVLRITYFLEQSSLLDKPDGYDTVRTAK